MILRVVGGILASVFVSFSIAAIRNPDRSDIRGQEYRPVHSSRCSSSKAAGTWKQRVSLSPQTRSRRQWLLAAAQLPFSISRVQDTLPEEWCHPQLKLGLLMSVNHAQKHISWVILGSVKLTVQSQAPGWGHASHSSGWKGTGPVISGTPAGA